jgi:hypothetical protein
MVAIGLPEDVVDLYIEKAIRELKDPRYQLSVKAYCPLTSLLTIVGTSQLEKRVVHDRHLRKEVRREVRSGMGSHPRRRQSDCMKGIFICKSLHISDIDIIAFDIRYIKMTELYSAILGPVSDYPHGSASLK